MFSNITLLTIACVIFLIIWILIIVLCLDKSHRILCFVGIHSYYEGPHGDHSDEAVNEYYEYLDEEIPSHDLYICQHCGVFKIMWNPGWFWSSHHPEIHM